MTGDTIVNVGDAFFALEIETLGTEPSGKFRYSTASVSLGEISEPIDLQFDFDAFDTDGDFISNTLDIRLAGQDLASNSLIEANGPGDGDSDVLVGGPGDDILLGGIGDDTLEGGGGADTFLYEAGDLGFDTIVDFAIGVDTIDLDALITGLGGDTGTSVIHGEVVGGDTVITIDIDGVGAGAVESNFSVTLSGVALSESDLASLFSDYAVVDDTI